jgi:hypothetical protein
VGVGVWGKVRGGPLGHRCVQILPSNCKTSSLLLVSGEGAQHAESPPPIPDKDRSPWSAAGCHRTETHPPHSLWAQAPNRGFPHYSRLLGSGQASAGVRACEDSCVLCLGPAGRSRCGSPPPGLCRHEPFPIVQVDLEVAGQLLGVGPRHSWEGPQHPLNTQAACTLLCK